MTPLISVLLPVLNGMPYLPLAVESILNQTLPHFELIVVNNGSTDETSEYLHALSDPRVRIVEMPQQGLVAALNRGLSECRAPFIARMDADDIAHSDRLALQVSVFDARPSVALCVGNADLIDGAGQPLGAYRGHTDRREILRRRLLGSAVGKPIIHPTASLRKSALEEVGWYRNFAAAEDRDLWLRITATHDFVWLPHSLLQYRVHSEGVSRRHQETQMVNSMLAIWNHMVLTSCGVDAYVEDPDALAAAQAKISSWCSNWASASVIAGAIRLAFRSRDLSRLSQLAGRANANVISELTGHSDARRYSLIKSLATQYCNSRFSQSNH